MYLWVATWDDDKKDIISSMFRNLSADLDAGWDFNSAHIAKQRQAIEDYVKEYFKQLEKIRDMSYEQAEHWCYIDLKRRGVIG